MRKVALSKSQIGPYLTELRGFRTQEEFGKELGVTKQAVTQYESGKSIPKGSILDALGIEVQYLAPKLKPKK